MKNAISYYRVSTRKQEESRLGIESQQKSVKDFAQARGYAIIKEHTEVESGKRDDRPVLQKALRDCRKQGATLLIARLDRLARSVFFISKLLDSKVDFIAVDMPDANKFVLHILSAVAEYERDRISTNTRNALQAAKKKGVELGTHVKYKLSKKNREAADDFAVRMKAVIKGLKEKGFKSLQRISDELNRLKIPTFRGAKFKWHPTTVFNILSRSTHQNSSSG